MAWGRTTRRGATAWLLRTAIAGGLALAAGGALAAEKTMRFGHMWPADSGWGQAAAKFAEAVNRNTGGRFEIRVYPAGQLGNERELFEGLSIGNLDFTFGGPGVLTNFDPKIGVFDMPFLFRDYAHANAVMDGPIGAQVFDSLRQKAGIRVLASGAQGFRYIVTKKAPINSIQDIKGVKIRVPEADTFLRTFRMIGANPVSIPWGETYMAVQSGVADGLEGVPEVLVNFKMYEVGKNVAKTNHVLATLQLLASEKTYQALPAEVQKVVSAAGREAWNAQREAAKAGNEKAEQDLAKLGVKFTTPDLAPFREAVRPLWGEWATKAGAKDVIDAMLR